MELEIDLNKLSLEELEMVLKLAKKAKSVKGRGRLESINQAVAPKLIEKEPPAVRSRKLAKGKHKDYESLSKEARRIILERGIVRLSELTKMFGLSISGTNYKKLIKALGKGER
jgi:hypothetical protein